MDGIIREKYVFYKFVVLDAHGTGLDTAMYVAHTLAHQSQVRGKKMPKAKTKSPSDLMHTSMTITYVPQ